MRLRTGLHRISALYSKIDDHVLSEKTERPIVGALLLAITSFLSLYWALVGIANTLQGFDWIPLGMFGVIAVVFGLVGSVMAKKRKNFALTMFAVCFPLVENVVVVKYSLENYQLPIPWIVIVLALIISTISGILIGRADEEFS